MANMFTVCVCFILIAIIIVCAVFNFFSLLLLNSAHYLSYVQL